MGNKSIKNVDGVMVLYLCTSSDGGLYFYKERDIKLFGRDIKLFGRDIKLL